MSFILLLVCALRFVIVIIEKYVIFYKKAQNRIRLINNNIKNSEKQFIRYYYSGKMREFESG